MNPTNKKKGLSVRTVSDVEEGSATTPTTPTSPLASEQDRANFQKLLQQMNGVSVSGKDGVSKPTPGQVRSENDLGKTKGKPDDTEVNLCDKHDKATSQKKKRKRGGKNSNKPSPNDSPQKTIHVKNSNQVSDRGPIRKEEGLRTSDSNLSQSAKMLKESSTSSKPVSGQIKPSKGSQNARSTNVAKCESQSNHEPIKEVAHGSHTSPLKQIESRHKLNAQELKSDVSTSDGQEMKPDNNTCGVVLHENGERDSVDPLRKQTLIPLRAAVNLIRPKKKNHHSKESNQFHCIPCDRELNDLDNHLQKSRDHFFRWKCEMRRRTIDLLPDLSLKHIKLLDELVTSTIAKCEMSDERYKQAHSLWESLDTLARTKLKDCSVRWFGTHANGTALSDNNVLNMDLLVQNKEDAASSFLKFISAVEEVFQGVERVVATNFAHANIFHNGMVVQLSLNNNGAFHTSKLLSDYISIDKRVQHLCLFFRYWGKLCEVDQGENGSWQGHAFPIMVIHFLQQKQVLPVLHELVSHPDSNAEVYLDPKHLQGCWASNNKDSVGQLLYQLFHFYAVEHDVEKHVVCITQKMPYLRKDTKWNAKRIAVIDPFQPKNNISRYISASMYDYVHFCLVSTTCALGIPRSDAGPLFGYICPRPEPSFFEQTPLVLNEYLDVSDKVFDLVLRLDSLYKGQGYEKGNEDKIAVLKDRLLKSTVFRELVYTLRVLPRVFDHKTIKNPYASWWVTPFQAVELSKRCSSDRLRIAFSKDLCTDNEQLPVTCTSCHRSGHIRMKCPDEIIPKLPPLPPPSDEVCNILSQLCLKLFETKCSEESGLQYRVEIRNDLLNYLRQYHKDVDLHLFGSSLNGFGGRSSDIDICLTFQSNPNGEGLNFPALVEQIQHELKNHKDIYQLLAITTAKVPIVKFEYGRNRIQVDISLYNRLGIMNTKLLHTYSVIDPRVRPLVYMMKYLAKITWIGDASRGSLSSYAYSLMSLYFLQQVQPPVIPVLQELYDPSEECREEIVDGANVYFFKNLDKLDKVWPHRNENTSSLGKLWLQLLEFYASDRFHSSKQVVSIRQKAPLFKFDKLWTSSNICIEDPFDLNHNLGSGLSKRMNIFIAKTFQKAYRHFSSLPRPSMPIENYYFHEDSLSAGKPPSDRGCHYCRSIGHVINDCPKRLMMLQRQGAMRSVGRPNRANNSRPNHGAYENFGRGANRWDQGRENYAMNRDPGRISNMPVPVSRTQPLVQPPQKPINQQNPSKHMNFQNHVVVGSMKPPGFPSAPPGFPLLPVRMVQPQIGPPMAPQMQRPMPQPMSPQMTPGGAAPFGFPHPHVRTYPWR